MDLCDETRLTKDQKTDLCNNVKIVKKFLYKHDVDIPFYIAGGSVFSILTRSSYLDIDVYFYNMNDFLLLKNALSDDDITAQTSNAITIKIEKKSEYQDLRRTSFGQLISDETITIQFINRNVGEPSEIFKTYDFNCCEVAFTHDHQYHQGDDFSVNIKVTKHEFKSNSINRYFKYVDTKGARDDNKNTLKVIVDFLIDNFYEKIKPSYSTPEKYSYGILNTIVNRKYADINNIINIKITRKFTTAKERVDAFEKVNNLIFVHVDNISDELMLHKLVALDAGKFKGEDRFTVSTIIRDRIMYDYPEYFI